MPYPNQLYTAFSFFSFFLVLIPLKNQLRAQNVGTCAFIFWIALGCLVAGINSVIWNANTVVRAEIWCDISIRVLIALNVAPNAASLCINRRLYRICSLNMTPTTQSKRRRELVIDLLIGGGIPLLHAALFTISQGHRGDILEEVGPVPEHVNCLLSILLYSLWPVVLGCISGIYGVLNLRNLTRRREILEELAARETGEKNAAAHEYAPQMIFAGMELTLATPLAIWVMYIEVTSAKFVIWPSWSFIHSDFNRFDQFPSVVWRSTPRSEILGEIQRWELVFCAFAFFAYFGFTAEMRRQYHSLWTTIASQIGTLRPLNKISILPARTHLVRSSGSSNILPPDHLQV